MSELTTTTPSPDADATCLPRSLNRQTVLEEDEYTEALSHIIARDFFPSLVHLDATNNYLDALRSADPHLIHASVRQLQELATPATARGHTRPLQTPSQTPWAGGPSETPLRTPSGSQSGRPNKRARYDADMSLDDFQACYTSEDNSSFTQILQDENVKRRERYGWAWEAQKRVEAQRGRMVEMRERLLIEPAYTAPGVREKFTIETPQIAGLISGSDDDSSDKSRNKETTEDGLESTAGAESYGSENALVFALVDTALEESIDVMAPTKDTRPAGVDTWKFKTRNALMFAPDADSSPYGSTSSSTNLPKGGTKLIKHANTRLPEQEEGTGGVELSEPPSPTRSRIDAAISGTPYRPSSPLGSYSLLPSMPSPSPEQLGPAAVKQLMTWGTLNATPRILSQSGAPDEEFTTPSTPFRISKPSSREVIGMKLSNDASKSLRVKATLMKGGSGIRSLPERTLGILKRSDAERMPPPLSATPKKADALGALTPAGRRLLSRTTSSVASSRRAAVMDKSAGCETKSAKGKEKDLNKVRWTPSPAPVERRRD